MLNNNSLKNNADNTTSGRIVIESGVIGVERHNAAIRIRARTDLNSYALPGIYFDCAGIYGACLYMDAYGRLHWANDNGQDIVLASL